MSRWAALPAELDPRVRQLVVRLRRLKDHSGLSLHRLAGRTGYSPKSWERYLGGRSLPPREAVEALARVGGEDPTRLLALHEVAAEAWARRRGDVTAAAADTSVPEATALDPTALEGAAPEPTAPEAAAQEPEAPEPAVQEPAATVPEILSVEVNGARAPGGSLRVALVAGTVALVVAVCTAVLLVVRLAGGEGAGVASPAVASAGPATSAASAPASASRSQPPYPCRVERVDGRWYAGNSRTEDAVLAYGHAGQEVAEVQCLLRRAGISPGGIDGIFGPLTERAVRQLQKRAGLVVDGIVGPHTWKALRR